MPECENPDSGGMRSGLQCWPSFITSSLRSESSNSPAECVARVKVFRGLDVIVAEYKATDQVPNEARAFTGWDQFALWFAAASLPAAWLYGGYMPGPYGLPAAFAPIFLGSTITVIPSCLLRSIAAGPSASSAFLLLTS